MTGREKVAEEVYTVTEAAKIKKVSPALIRRAINSTDAHRLYAKRVGKGFRISASALDAWFAGLDDA